MKVYLLYIVFFVNVLLAENIDSILQEFESNTDKSLYTVDETLGHVTIYSQKDLRLMQYNTISDLLKELPLSNLNRNRFGISALSLPGSKTDVGGFFRIFINNHEVSSNYTQSIPETWMEFPMDMVDYVEVYRGDSSFSLGSGNGIFFIRIYTKRPLKQNGTKLIARLRNTGSNSQSITHSETLENSWSYLVYASNNKTKNHATYKGNRINNNSNKNYLYLNIEKDDTSINMGYAKAKKENYFGFSLDVNPDDGELDSEDYFVDLTTYFLEDKSIKLNVSFDVNDLKYEEFNQEGLAIVPVLDWMNLGMTIPKYYTYDGKVVQTNAFISKRINFAGNNLLLGLDYQYKKYKIRDNTAVNFLNSTTNIGSFNDFNKEEIYSIFFQDDYRVNKDLLLVLNTKIDKHRRAGMLEDTTDNQYKMGMIYTPHKNFGLKAFYTKTYIAPSFYNIDYADKNDIYLKKQRYKFYEIEAVYANEYSRLSFLYNNVHIKDFIYFTPIGFTNIDHTVKSKGFILDYTYELTQNNKLELNYFKTKLSETLNNSNKGGYVKFMGEYGSFEYFTSLIYRNAYKYYDVKVDDSYNFSFGSTYNATKNLSFSLKVENVFDNSTKSLYKEGLVGGDFALKDYLNEVTFSMKWVF